MLSQLTVAKVRAVVVAALLIGFGLVVLGVVLEKYRLLPARAVDRVLDRSNGTDVAQSDAKLLGKIIKIDTAKGTWTTISKGHRNTQGLVITANREIWSTEHGPAGGDELNRIVAGANYGWCSSGWYHGRRMSG
jgi:hypothetical protein